MAKRFFDAVYFTGWSLARWSEGVCRLLWRVFEAVEVLWPLYVYLSPVL